MLGWQQKTFEAWAQFHAAAEHEAAHEYGLQVARLAKADEIVAAMGAARTRVPPPPSCKRAWARRPRRDLARAREGRYATTIRSTPSAAVVRHEAALGRVRADRPLASRARAAPARRRRRRRVRRRRWRRRHFKIAAEAAAADAADEEADLFTALVPLSVLSDASVYTARRDDLLRDLADAVATVRMTEDADLASLDLPDALHAAERPADLPEEYLLALGRGACRRRGGRAARGVDRPGARARPREPGDGGGGVARGGGGRGQPAARGAWRQVARASVGAAQRRGDRRAGDAQGEARTGGGRRRRARRAVRRCA